MHDVVLVILVILLASLCLAPVLLLMGRRRQEGPAVFAISSDCARRHIALVWLIRGTYIFTAVFFTIYLLGILVAVPFGVIIRELSNLSNPSGYRITVAVFGLILVLFYGVVVKRIYRNFRKGIGELNTDTVANFSIIFAILLAYDLHHFLPPNLPQVFLHYFKGNPFLAPLVAPGPGIHFWGLLTIIAFFAFNKSIKTYLMRVLELNPPEPPPKPDTSISSRSDGRFVPFDPYILSKNPPIAPARE